MTRFRRPEVDLWINAVMTGVPEICSVYDWHTVDDDVVVFHCQNRRDNPHDEGPEYWDFAGLSALWYAGDVLWRADEDYRDRDGARRTSIDDSAACARAGVTDPIERMTRRHRGAAPPWVRTDAEPHPTWLDRLELPAATRPSQIYALLGRPRDLV